MLDPRFVPRLEGDASSAGLERRQGGMIVRDSFGKDHYGAATAKYRAQRAKGPSVALWIPRALDRPLFDVALPDERYHANPIEESRERWMTEQCCFRREHDAARYGPRHKHRVHERVGVVANQ